MVHSVQYRGYRPGNQKTVVLFLVVARDFALLSECPGRLWDLSGPFNGNRG